LKHTCVNVNLGQNHDVTVFSPSPDSVACIHESIFCHNLENNRIMNVTKSSLRSTSKQTHDWYSKVVAARTRLDVDPFRDLEKSTSFVRRQYITINGTTMYGSIPVWT
jgi:hypothetical protein